MVSSILTRKNLIAAAGLLMVIKFALLPIVSWQNDKISELQAKFRQLEKVTKILENQSIYSESLSTLRSRLSEETARFYIDNARAQLIIQTDVEQVFARNNVTLDGFSWGVDASGPIRIMRATVRFSGRTSNMIRSFWELERLPRRVKLVESRQQLKTFGGDGLGGTKGSATLEFYVLGEEFFKDVGELDDLDQIASGVGY